MPRHQVNDLLSQSVELITWSVISLSLQLNELSCWVLYLFLHHICVGSVTVLLVSINSSLVVTLTAHKHVSNHELAVYVLVQIVKKNLKSDLIWSVIMLIILHKTICLQTIHEVLSSQTLNRIISQHKTELHNRKVIKMCADSVMNEIIIIKFVHIYFI